MPTWKILNEYEDEKISYGRSEINFPGVYAFYLMNVITCKKRLIYIGSSSAIGKRLKNHNLSNRGKFPWFSVVKIKLCDNYLEIEKKLIKKLKPILNKTFKK